MGLCDRHAQGQAEALDPELPRDWYYVSFTDGTRPVGDQFIGGVYLLSPSRDAVLPCAALIGVNPGGSAAIVGPLPAEQLQEMVPEDERGRLLTREEVEAR